jgi:hypothetical protein
MSDLPENDQHMPLVSHLTELRTRLLRCVAAIFIIFAGLFAFTQQIYTFVSTPLRAYLPAGATMIATDVSSPFLTPLKLTMMVSLFLAIPVILHQIWGFIAPGLYKHEKRIAVPLLVSSIFLFYAGMAFAYFLVFPLIFKFFAAATPAGVEMMTDITSYLDVDRRGRRQIPEEDPPVRDHRLFRGRHDPDTAGHLLADPAGRADVAAVRDRHPVRQPDQQAWRPSGRPTG